MASRAVTTKITNKNATIAKYAEWRPFQPYAIRE